MLGVTVKLINRWFRFSTSFKRRTPTTGYDKSHMIKSRLILVGGFLGAGKTTLLAEMARILTADGKRVGLITNDQAPDLVDTALLSRRHDSVAEVSGSCFCCNFNGLLAAIENLRYGANADVVIAEPVGSCTDLSATIVQPLKDWHSGELEVGPLSVLADPARLEDILSGGLCGFHPSATYIYVKQLEEADIIVISKSDTLSADALEKLAVKVAKAYPLASVYPVSAKTGVGLAAWLETAMARSDAGRHLAEVDYDVYAEGEAVLGWLNATFSLTGSGIHWRDFAIDLLRNLSYRFDSAKASVGHVKLLIESGKDSIGGNLTGGVETLSVRGVDLIGSAAKLTLNARVEMSPESVESIVMDVITSTTAGRIKAATVSLRCLSPGRPTPTHRYDHLVALS